MAMTRTGGPVCSEKSRDDTRRERLIATFLRGLEATVRKGWEWTLDQFGRIRGKHGEIPYLLCPIEAAYWNKHGKLDGDVHQLAERMGLGIVAYQLVHAFDSQPHGVLGVKVQKALGM